MGKEQNLGIDGSKTRGPGYLRKTLPGYEPTPVYLKAVLSNQTQVGVQKDYRDPETELGLAASLEGDPEERQKFRTAFADLMQSTHRELMRRPFNIDTGFLTRLIVTHEFLAEDVRPQISPQILARWAQEPALRGRTYYDMAPMNIHFLATGLAFRMGAPIPEEVLEQDLHDDRFALTAVMIATQQSLPKGAEFFSRWVDHRLKIAAIPIDDVDFGIAIWNITNFIEDEFGHDRLRTFITNAAGRLRLPSIPRSLEELVIQYSKANIRVDRDHRTTQAQRVNSMTKQDLSKWMYEQLQDSGYNPKGGSTFGLFGDVYKLLGEPQKKIVRNMIIDDLADLGNNPQSIWTEYRADNLLKLPADILIEHQDERIEVLPYVLQIAEDPRFFPAVPVDHNKFYSFDFHLRAVETLIGLQYSPHNLDYWAMLYHAVPREKRNESSYQGMVTSALTSYGLKFALEWILQVADKTSVVEDIEELLFESGLDKETDLEERKAALESILTGLPSNLARRIRRAAKRVEIDVLESETT